MTQKIKTLIVSLSLLFSFATAAFIPAVASAVTCPPSSSSSSSTGFNQDEINCQLGCGSNGQLNQSTQGGNATGQNCNTAGTSDFNSVLKRIINILSVIVGAIAVVMVIIGGFRYVTSAGSESGVSGAKKTIMYALIGLIIVALAQVIVHFVLNNIT